MASDRTVFEVRKEHDQDTIKSINGVPVDSDMIVIPDPQLSNDRMFDSSAILAFEKIRTFSDALRPTKAVPFDVE